ncbi:MAG TPA: YidC/Oxa1 family membrane protein insertase [Candidatus Scybalousia intestinigallinarum]|nr:YidC/Oxa1 family membrane protein insertase [Candidatus Scybalousia intestinigallinarum]
MKYKNKLIILLVAVLLLTGCTTTLKTEDKKVVKNPETGQSLTANILCKPTNEETIKAYEENGVDLAALPKCSEFSITSGGYDGLWTSLFVKPLAFIILFIMKFVKSAGLALILTSLALRLILYPVTKKTAMQSELIKKAKPDLDRLEKKYKDKTDQDSLMRKSQEMTMIYKKYNINPISGCLYSFIQLPLFIAFLEAINRVPALFEETFLTLQLGTTPSVGLFTNGNIAYIILIILVGVTTYFSFNLNKTTAQTQDDPMKNMTNIMTGMIVVMGFFMPAALCVYWITTNAFTIAQNLIVKRSKEVC